MEGMGLSRLVQVLSRILYEVQFGENNVRVAHTTRKKPYVQRFEEEAEPEVAVDSSPTTDY
jgi:hypothetical protein